MSGGEGVENGGGVFHTIDIFIVDTFYFTTPAPAIEYETTEIRIDMYAHHTCRFPIKNPNSKVKKPFTQMAHYSNERLPKCIALEYAFHSNAFYPSTFNPKI